MRFLFLTLLVSLSVNAKDVIFKAEYPMGPESELTPGSLCDRPDQYRYPEHIAYCNRDVDSHLKKEIFEDYRQEGYRLDPKDRPNYKIDHLIPLCAGGSNHEDNLWPQHVTIYTQTDPLESIGCEKLKAGRIKQAELIRLILEAKKNLNLVKKTLLLLTNL
jgi:hypothetical protein